MASLLIYAGVLTYDKVQKSREKKRAARNSRNQLRYSELEEDHAKDLARTQSGSREICHCEKEGWDGRTHTESCTRGRLARNRDELRGFIDGPRDVEKKGSEMTSSEGPPSYNISEKEYKSKRGILGRNSKEDEHIVR